jgi:asparagine synthase (glutamine-hydrolysing)
MCGLGGVFWPKSKTPRDPNMTAILGSIAHRGPDGEEVFKSSDARYAVGFRRLAVIDLETGSQPIADLSSKRVLVGNGEIYNYLELRRDENNYPYKTSGDMEVILPLASKYGDQFLDHLNGMFAVALYDEQQHRLLLARDRLGIKPLYWAELSGGGLIFGSEIKALFASGLLDRAVNERAVSAYLAHGYVPAPETLFKGIQKLPPGHLLTINAEGKIEIEQYWRAQPSADLPRERPEIEAHLENLLRDSVHLQMRSDVPVGALLSGGIDSSLMVAMAAEVSDQPINTFTVSFEGAAVDEAPLAKMIAERYETHHTRVMLSTKSIADYMPKLVWYCDEPVNDAAMLPNFLIEEMLSENITVALNGTGGDELFAGYGRYFKLPVEKRYAYLPLWLRQSLIEPMVDTVSPMTAWQLRRAQKFDTDPGSYLHEHSTFFPDNIRALMGNQQALPEQAQKAYFDAYSGPRQSGVLYADLNTYLPDQLLTLLDRTTMASSVEGRVPFLDHRLVEAALAVPPEMRTPGAAPKFLERQIAKSLLPPEIINAPKQGFASPVPVWMKAGLGQYAAKILTQTRSLDRGWWTKAGIEKMTLSPNVHGFRLYSLLFLELTIRIHVEDSLINPPSDGLEQFSDAA